MAERASKKKQSKIKAYFGSYNFLGVTIGMLLVLMGFGPTLLPRGWVLQGVINGVLFLTGYAFGMIVSHFYRRFHAPELKLETRVRIKQYTYSVLFLSYLILLILGFYWQEDVRILVEQPPAQLYTVLGTPFVALLLIAFILLIARSIRSLYSWLKRLASKHIPKPIAYTDAWVLTVLVVIGLFNGVILSSLTEALNQAFSVKNGTTNEGIVQPKDPHLSGSSQSLIPWDTLGRQGRNFIGRAPTTDKLSSFNQTPATQPVRIYSGLESASSTEARAELATKDLKRAGGYDRKIIVVATTTGTGWVDEQGVVPVEYMYNGDSAIVSMQYSYLPSWLSFLVDQSKAKAAGKELYNALYNEALNIPEERRPKIVVFGESLGSFGGESAFSGEADFRASTDGAVWAGPPNFNILRKTATANRDPGSPEILPVYKQGQVVRFAAAPNDFNNPAKPWGTPRAVYLENPSDPIVWWSPHLIFNQPDWLKEPRGADVIYRTRWLPIVTFWGVTGDMVFSTGVPDGHGHKYGNLPADAWSYVAPPEGWTPQKTQALHKELGG